MGNIAWTKSWSATDNGTVFGGADLQNIQGDITTVTNGGITNSNVNASAAIAESKLAFDTSAGHDHDGTNSAAVATAIGRHYREGCLLKAGSTADTDILVSAGVIVVGGTLLTDVDDTSDIDISVAGNWIYGSSAVSTWVYVYAYSNSGSLAFKLSTEAPDLSDGDGETTEIPFRYQLYSAVYYRCIGCVYIDASGDLCWASDSGLTQASEGYYVSQFDASNVCIVNGLGTGADQTLNTIWTPKQVRVIFGTADATPGNAENITVYETTQLMIDATWDMCGVGADQIAGINTGKWVNAASAAGCKTITSQAAGTSGSFTIHAATDNFFWYAIAWTDEV